MIGLNYASDAVSIPADYGETIYESCLGAESDSLNECIANRLELSQIKNAQDRNTWVLIFAASLIFFMQAGFAMLCAGNVRIKNVGEFFFRF